MFRTIVGAALPLLGLGLVAAYAGPDLVTGPQGAPLVVDGTNVAGLTKASFDQEECAAAYLLGREPGAPGAKPAVRIIAYGLRPNGQEIELGIRDLPGAAPRETVTLLFDTAGRLVAAGKPTMLQAGVAAACSGTPKPHSRNPV